MGFTKYRRLVGAWGHKGSMEGILGGLGHAHLWRAFWGQHPPNGGHFGNYGTSPFLRNFASQNLAPSSPKNLELLKVRSIQKRARKFLKNKGQEHPKMHLKRV